MNYKWSLLHMHDDLEVSTLSIVAEPLRLRVGACARGAIGTGSRSATESNQDVAEPLRLRVGARRRCTILSAIVCGVLAALPLAAASRPEVIPVDPNPGNVVPAEVMQRVYEEVKTPFKYGVVLKGEEGEMVDCPNVFRHQGRWYMMYVAIRDKVGYQTYLARSDDLLHWEKLGRILSHREQDWDAWQADGGVALYDLEWGGDAELDRHDGRYWLSYIGGAKQGYEPDPLAIGLASTERPDVAEEWLRFDGNPILAPHQSDVRPWEEVTLYKSAIIRDESRSLGYPFVMFYNGKAKQANHEAIGMAVSDDLRHWIRYGASPVVDNAPGEPAISGDPQITRIGDVWVMFYFGHRWQPKAFDTFAVSYDLVNWTKWEGAHLVEPGEAYDKTFAHKPWLLKHDGVVYHFYCAVGDQGRVIALATSTDLREQARSE